MHHSRVTPISLLLLLWVSACTPRPQTATTTSPSQVDTAAERVSESQNRAASRVAVSYQSSRRRLHDLIHTRLALSFDYSAETVEGEAWLELEPYFYTQDSVVLDAKGFLWHEVALLQGDLKSALNHNYDSLRLAIKLDRPYQKGERFWLYLRYTAQPSSIPGFGNEAIQGEQGLYFINPTGVGEKPTQIWTQGETEFSSCWFPTIDAPNEKMTQEISLTVPAQYTTLSNGVLISSQALGDSLRTDYWKLEKPHAPYLAMVAVGEWDVVQEEWQGKPVQYFVEPTYTQYAKDIFGNTPEMITFFSDRLGVPFPWPKYAQIVVRDFVSGAMENTTASVFMEDLQVDSRSLLDEHWDQIIAHELFHQWFGDLVTCESWANLPLNESFANYSEYLWLEHKYGRDSADYHAMEELFDYFEEANNQIKPLIRYYHADPGDMFDRHSYNKGGRVLHMLRYYLGDEAFFAGLREYLTTHAYQSAEIHDLRQAFEKVSGEDLNWFFNQWFMLPGHPTLQVTHQYDSATQALQINVAQAQDPDQMPLFRIPLTFEVWQKGKPQRTTVWVEQSQHQFKWPMDQAPELVLADPDRQLLGYLVHPKETEMLVHQVDKASHFFYRLSAMNELVEANLLSSQKLYQLGLKMLQDPFWLNRVAALDVLAENQLAVEDQLNTRLVSLAEKDPIPLVRAESLSVLATQTSDLTPFHQGLKDSAYSVVGASIDALTAQSISTDSLEAIFAPFQRHTNYQVVLPLADFYLIREVSGQLPWFLNQLDTMGSEDRYYFMPYLGEYMLPMTEDEKREGMEKLVQVARQDESYFVRATALNTLEMLDIEGVWSSKAQEIRSLESDPRFFETIGEAPPAEGK